ncbi:hypothetical protein H8356DRAFT_1702030 [Neocallimastix lanati (nom. inval.)]|jgi:hypothetical protein|uniref:Mediator of RNA polymerase II transcription subunit 4 n=1 Tax=Neocallimastix californiae TaxID=1754190 RepID=A0A1Y2BVE5_9FUNG|nr:hypothetical protein H8356DRAFT_1702030 [Neocallimastix sp. JGI-2020a]ORY38731.1 hypothetical protein LY90DRAFT_704414 [Neocallimastix californiae]|eukprot:ORY38731.1 hypothetical protein LY90DRAFT_704414 [Neocallimastix californiae]
MDINRNYSQKSIFNDILQKYSDLIKKLFNSLEGLSQGNKPEPSVQTTIHDIIEIDKCLQVALIGLEEHQYLQKKIEAAQKTSELYNIALLSLVRKLKSAEVELENVLSNAKIKLKNLQDADKRKIDYKELISYSQRIAPYTSAPPNWKDTDGFDNIPNRPPIPEESMFRFSALYQNNGNITEDNRNEDEDNDNIIMEENKVNVDSYLGLDPLQGDQESLLDLDLDDF